MVHNTQSRKEAVMPKPARIGPTLTDTINAKKIVAVLKKNPSLGKWMVGKLRTKRGPRDLIALFHVEGIK